MTKKVIIWGYPPHTHTHSYIHYGFAKAFSSLDYDVVWYEDNPEYSNEDLSDAIVISEVNCCKHLPIDKSSKYFIHNVSDDFIDQNKIDGDNIYNFLVYHENYSWDKCENIVKVDDHSWFDSKTKTFVTMWASDLLPDEIDNQTEVLYDPNKTNINYIGTLSSEYTSNFVDVVKSNNKTFKNYGGYTGEKSKDTSIGFVDEDKNISLAKDSYLNFDIRPQVHLDNGYIPCRIFKTMSYGCWIGTNSIKVEKFFEGRITTDTDLNILYKKTEEDCKNATKDILRDNMNYIKNHHTYINRAKALVNII